ncbi:MAG TPA: hypothetical protein VGF48_03965 [Thermoanaerobaculia bacterium]|jgi:Tol biopolymer transport system component
MIRTLPLLVTLLMAPLLTAQGPSASWRTVNTKHFRLHFPAEYQEWSMRAATRLESIHAEVAREVGFDPPQVIDVVISNPIADANGAAWPLLDSPRILFYTEPPGPDEQLGAYGHWIDLLAVHEVAHVVHMLRPSRNPLNRLVEKSILPLNPITLRAPRWVLEGYATVIEGRLTGAGRPTSTMRALILREWARNGRLPSYGQLNSDQRFLGMSMAYLMGSAYLEWLEARSGPGALRNVWARLTARQQRSFDAAFTGVFGESPARLYGRFVAELTAASIAIDRPNELQEGELWQETTRGSGDPAVSPDGKLIAVVQRPREKPERLVIWSTEGATEEEKKFEERLAKILQRDPQDVAPVRTRPLPRKVRHSLTMRDGGDIDTPRWTRDGRSLLFAHRAPDREGFLHFDLYRWTPETDRVERLTHLADVRDADPYPDGRSAIAVRSRYGASQLVRVDLESGAIAEINEPSIDLVYNHPRVSPDGTRIAYVVHQEGSWRVVWASSPPGAVPEGGLQAHTTPRNDASSAEWISNDELVATFAGAGFAELHRVRADGTTTPLTRSAGGAFDPAPSPDGRIFFMSLDPDGYVVRILPSAAPAPSARPAYEAALVPAIPPPAPRVQPFAQQPVNAPHNYGIGRQELGWFVSQNLGPAQRATELGVRFGDVVGRLDTLVIGSLASDDAHEGFAIASAWRGWPVELLGHAFHAEESGLTREGVEVRGLWTSRGALRNVRLEAGGLAGQPRDLLFAEGAVTTRQIRTSWSASQSLRLAVDGGDETHWRAVAGAAFRMGGWRLGARYQHDDGGRIDVGGLPSSIVPRSALATRVFDPALPPRMLRGNRYDGWRIEALTPFLPLTAFYQRHEMHRDELSVAGLELELGSEPLPILKFPGVDFTAGVARLLDLDETRWWLGIRWRP